MIHDCTGVVLAGGASRRMGRDKAEIDICGETLLQLVCRVLGEVFDDVLCVGRGDDGSNPVVRSVPDERPGMGPLAGIETALRRTSTAWVFVAACDMPMLTAEAVELIWRRGGGAAKGGVVPRVAERIHPLAGFYPRAVLPSASAALDDGRLSATAFVRETGACVVDFDGDERLVRALTNVNDPGELERATAEMRTGGAGS